LKLSSLTKLLALLLFGLIFCFQTSGRAVSANPLPSGSALQTEQIKEEITLDCLTEEVVDSIRMTGDMEAAQQGCQSELEKKFGREFDNVDMKGWRAILASIVVANFAEYGSHQSGLTFEELAKSDYLDCASALVLMGHLFGMDDPDLRPIGFYGGAVGNHAQALFVGNTSILLDPTTGVVALTNFDDLVRGLPVPSSDVRVVSIKARLINSFRHKVLSSILSGAYLPSDIMYMHETVGEFLRKGSSDNYFTPGGIEVRKALTMVAN
jgi:hypothetical protein